MYDYDRGIAGVLAFAGYLEPEDYANFALPFDQHVKEKEREHCVLLLLQTNDLSFARV